MLATQASSRATEAKMRTERKMEKYRGPVVVVVALMMKPMPEIKPVNAQNGPRILKRSDSQVTRMM